MPFIQSLHSKLTFSHLAVTIITVFLLELLMLGGMVLYFRSDAPASWVGEEAAGLANNLAWELEDAPLDRMRAEEFILSYFFLPVFDEEGEFLFEDEAQLSEEELAEMEALIEDGFSVDIEAESVIIFDTQSRVLASTDEARFTPGVTLTAEKLVGFDEDFLTTFSSWDKEVVFEDVEWPRRYTAVGNDHIGQSVILNTQGEVVGGIYYRAFDITEWFWLNDTLQVLSLGLLGAAILAIIISGVMGSLLARSFGRRFAYLNAASIAFAAGNLEQRVLITGNDEIDQVGVQFNTMADQIANQMLELRQLAERNALLAEEARALASLNERQRLARELHDAVKQQLFGLSLTAGSIGPLMARDADKANQRLKQLAQQSRDIYTEMDRIIHQLRPAALEDRGLAAALQELVAKWKDQHDLPVVLEIKGARELSLVTEQALYRVCQEAFSNITRHAEASEVMLYLQYDLDEVTLHITDNGKGFDSNLSLPTKAMGIRGMQERISEIGGRFMIESTPNEGTKITAIIPARFSVRVTEYR